MLFIGIIEFETYVKNWKFNNENSHTLLKILKTSWKLTNIILLYKLLKPVKIVHKKLLSRWKITIKYTQSNSVIVL